MRCQLSDAKDPVYPEFASHFLTTTNVQMTNYD
jgi:hypothetical protein